MSGTIYNQTELEAAIGDSIYSNTQGDVSGDDVRDRMFDIIASLQSYPGVIDGDAVAGISITATPANIASFNSNATTANELLEADQANDRIKVFEPGLYFITLRFNGSWAANEDLTFELFVNGAANPITPATYTQEGQGAADPIVVSITDIAFIINSSMIAAGPGGTFAELELYVSSATGTFTVDQTSIQLGAEYNPLSIRTVG